MKKFDANPLYGNFEELGEDQVRTNLASGIYNEKKANLARRWLEKKAQERTDAFTREQIEIARDAAASARDAADSARDAASSARTQATEARRANKIAKTAIAIAIIGAMISIMTYFRDQDSSETASSAPAPPPAQNP